MKYYCKKCSCINEQDFCSQCGKKNLDSPKQGDYCFFADENLKLAEVIKGVLQSEGIPFVDVPSGSGIRTVFALKLENLRIYVPYEFFNQARQVLTDHIKASQEAQSQTLKENVHRLFAKREKRIRKRLKIDKDKSLVDYCAKAIMNADFVENRGRISSCLSGGEYLFVCCGKEMYTINSATYEILSAQIKK